MGRAAVLGERTPATRGAVEEGDDGGGSAEGKGRGGWGDGARGVGAAAGWRWRRAGRRGARVEKKRREQLRGEEKDKIPGTRKEIAGT